VDDEREVLAFPDRDAWAAWLAEEHASSPGVWLKLAKKGSGKGSVSYEEAVDAALCYGWIDGQGAPYDDRFSLQRFTPRRARSVWSKRNRAKAEALMASGAMQAAGLREVERAKADGRWERAYDSPSTATVSDDLREALDREPDAAALFAELDGRNRYAILYRVQDAKRPETRARRIAQFVAMLKAGDTPYPRRSRRV
jgi:uncharacterized protein YdeI (YjbR/CyaY-like superfamily)